MVDGKRSKQKFADFKPSKTLWIWSCIGTAALTMIVGFTLGGWVTGGTAEEMAETAAEEARAELVAAACVERFVKGPEFAKNLTILKEASSWERSDVIEEGGWATLAGMNEPLDDAAEICADKVAAMTAPVAGKSGDKATVTK
jgi:flavodoxin